MIRTLLKVGVILVLGILVYNYFMGSPEEKATSEKIFKEVKDLGKATWDLLKAEKEKFDDGKYDDALQKVEDLYDRLRGRAESDSDPEMVDRINQLDEERKELKKRVEEAEKKTDSLSKEQKDQLKEDWDRLVRETERLMKDMEKN